MFVNKVVNNSIVNNINKVFNVKSVLNNIPLVAVSSMALVQQVKDVFKNNRTEQTAVFINDVIKNQDTDVDEVLKTYNFQKYGKNGIPLEYSRPHFVNDVKKFLFLMNNRDKANILSNFNLRLGEDIDGIAQKIDNPLNKKEDAINSAIDKYYYSNPVKIEDEKVRSVMTKITEGMPEFKMAIGKVQHDTHIYSVDIHSLDVLQRSLNNPEYKDLDEESKQVLKLSVLMHDFGKDGYVVTKDHALQSEIDAEKILPRYNLPDDVKTRVLNQIRNHHWFKSFNKKMTNEEDVKKIFTTEQDLKIAKIIAKADLEGIGNNFHFYCLQCNSQDAFNKKFESITKNLHY